jgi:two-component system LytT family sensor kinase
MPALDQGIMTDADLELPHTSPDQFRLSRRELVFIVAFWSVYALLSAASRVFDRGIGSLPWSGTLGVPFIEAFCWMLLTPPIFLLAGRLEGSHRRSTQILVFSLLGVAVALLLGTFGNELRHALTPFRPQGGLPSLPDSVGGALRRAGRGGSGPPRGGGGPPVWFGILNALVLYVGVVAAALARTYSRRYHLRREQAARREARLEAQLAEARLDALRRQLDPHFLFNTLNAVSALVERDPRGVRRMIMRLSELLRHSFEGGGEAVVPLRAELALLTRYVDIMQVRFQGRLNVETRVDERALDALVPSMILQPLVENAIKHGVERTTGAGEIRIDAECTDSELVLRVRDNGPGLSGSVDASGRVGVGVRNTIARLEQLYGRGERFSMTAGTDGGTVAELRLPFRSGRESVDPSAAADDRRPAGDASVPGGGTRVS